MKKYNRALISLLLVLVMAVSLSVTALADGSFDYTGYPVVIVDQSGFPFGSFVFPNDETSITIIGDNVSIHYVPFTRFRGYHLGAFTDSKLTNDVYVNEDGSFDLILPKSECKKAIPFSPLGAPFYSLAGFVPLEYGAISLAAYFDSQTYLLIPSLKESDADVLYNLGLFRGVGTNPDGTPNFDLDREPTRNEAVTMLVRLLGKEEDAKSKTWDIPFTDVADWAKPYVGYAYANGLTKGTSASTFGGDSLVSATQYLTFVLRALGYDSSSDFKWDAAWELSDKLLMTNGNYNADSSFLRKDIAKISLAALSVPLKNDTKTLGSKLADEHVLTNQMLVEYAIPLIAYTTAVINLPKTPIGYGDFERYASGFETGLYNILTDVSYEVISLNSGQCSIVFSVSMKRNGGYGFGYDGNEPEIAYELDGFFALYNSNGEQVGQYRCHISDVPYGEVGTATFNALVANGEYTLKVQNRTTTFPQGAHWVETYTDVD